MLTVAALYHFAPLPNPAEVRPGILALCEAEGIRGSLLLAEEGMNGTLAGPEAGIAKLIAHLRALPGFADLEWKASQAEAPPFARLKVRLKREIVTMGRPVDPRAAVGTYVAPEDWNALLADPQVAVIDTRNDYEVAIGTFEGAIDPKIESFRDFPRWWAEHRADFAGKKIAMFCTGGIRCEKSTALLREEGHGEVFHLKGGILKYLEEVAPAESRWQGECFVFDQRVALTHGLEPGTHALCYGCRRPVSPQDMAHPDYEAGVSCPACREGQSAADRARFRERALQIRLAKARGAVHLGQAGGPPGQDLSKVAPD